MICLTTELSEQTNKNTASFISIATLITFLRSWSLEITEGLGRLLVNIFTYQLLELKLIQYQERQEQIS